MARQLKLERIISFAILTALTNAQQLDTLGELGTLYDFTPPSGCSTFAIYRTNMFAFNTRTTYTTDFMQGCHLSRTSCCPPNYNGIGGFYSPAAGCPAGYTSQDTMTFSGRRYLAGTNELSLKEGVVCCPRVVDPVSTYEFDGDFAFLGYCQGTILKSSSGSLFSESYYSARAIVVVTGGVAAAPAPTTTNNRPPNNNVESTSATPRRTSNGGIPSETSIQPPSRTVESEPSDSEESNPSDSESSDRGNDERTNSQGQGQGGLSTGAIVGIVLGVAIPVLLGGVYAAYLFGRRKEKSMTLAPPVLEPSKFEQFGVQGYNMGGIQVDKT